MKDIILVLLIAVVIDSLVVFYHIIGEICKERSK